MVITVGPNGWQQNKFQVRIAGCSKSRSRAWLLHWLLQANECVTRAGAVAHSVD